MSDKIRVNYPALEDMANHCMKVSERLHQTAANAQKIAQQMQGGALQGPPGDVFVQALGIFQQRVAKLATKFQEEANDIRGAISDMRQADSSAGNQF